jgi:hypothetical protein
LLSRDILPPCGRINQFAEQGEVLGAIVQLLRVPLNGQKEVAPGVFDRFDQPVLAECGGDQSPADAVHHLVVAAVDFNAAVAVNSLRQARAGLNVNNVVLSPAGVLRYFGEMIQSAGRRGRRHVWDVLVQRAAAGDVEQLAAQADAEDRHVRPAVYEIEHAEYVFLQPARQDLRLLMPRLAITESE